LLSHPRVAGDQVGRERHSCSEAPGPYEGGHEPWTNTAPLPGRSRRCGWPIRCRCETYCGRRRSV